LDNQPKIPGGYILISRRLIESRIMSKPPLYLKVWVWMLLRAQHKEFSGLKKGQLRASIPEVQEAMTYKAGYRTVKPSYKEIRQVFDWLRNPDEALAEGTMKGTMIVTTKGTHKMTINIENYCYYQDPNNYEGHTEGQDEKSTKGLRRARQGRAMNKNDKEIKNDIKDIVEYGQIIDYLNHVCGTSYKSTTKATQEHIRARWNEGFRVDDFKKVIDIKAKEWLNDPRMSKFLRPETLFSNKFESYLNQISGGQGSSNGGPVPEGHSQKEKEFIRSLYIKGPQDPDKAKKKEFIRSLCK
jgi:uncharacterized phage protein (TIGR02220 family)